MIFKDKWPNLSKKSIRRKMHITNILTTGAERIKKCSPIFALFVTRSCASFAFPAPPM